MDGRLPGREAELGIIAEAIARAASGTPTAVLVEGEAGGGRTALLRSLEDSPLLPRGRIRVVPLDLAGGGDPVLMAAGALTHHAAFARVGGRRRALAAFRKLLPDWIGAIPGWGDLLEAITTTAAALRRRRGGPAPRTSVAEEIEEVQKAARRRAAALLIDGAEGIGPPAAERLFQLIDSAQTGTRLLVVAAWRPPSPGSPPPPAVAALNRLPAGRRARVLLRPLDRAAIAVWLERRLGGSISPALVDEVLEASGGLPRAVESRIAALQSSDALRRTEEGWAAIQREDAAPSPGDLAPAEVDLGPLGDDVRATLTAAAALDITFAALDVARALRRDELWTEDRLAAATRLGVLHLVHDAYEVDGEITSLYRFASSALRAALRHSVAAGPRATG